MNVLSLNCTSTTNTGGSIGERSCQGTQACKLASSLAMVGSDSCVGTGYSCNSIGGKPTVRSFIDLIFFLTCVPNAILYELNFILRLRSGHYRKWLMVRCVIWKWLHPCSFLSFASCHIVLTTLYHNVLPKHAARGNRHALVLLVSEFHSLTLLMHVRAVFLIKCTYPTHPLHTASTSLSWSDKHWKWILVRISNGSCMIISLSNHL